VELRRFFRRVFLLRTARVPVTTPPQNPKEESPPGQDPPPAHNRF